MSDSSQSERPRRTALPRIYADHAATTPLSPAALSAMLPYLREAFGNPSSIHEAGARARHALRDARNEIAACIGARPDEVFFTAGGTESDNWALKGTVLALRRRGGIGHPVRLLASAIEHHAVLQACHSLEEDGLATSAFLPPNGNGVISAETLSASLEGQGAGLVSVMLANNEIGTIEPIAELSAAARQAGALFHTDAVQAMGHIPIDVNRLGIDLLSASAHKFNGPKGVGFLYCRKGTPLRPLLDGGQQEAGLRAGTENLPGVVGMAAALRENCAALAENSARLTRLAEWLRSLLQAELPAIRFLGDASNRLPGHLCAALPDVSAESLVHLLDLRGIAISAGAACNSRSLEVSHVLKAIGLPQKYARGAIRISLGLKNTDEEIPRIAREVIAACQKQ